MNEQIIVIDIGEDEPLLIVVNPYTEVTSDA